MVELFVACPECGLREKLTHSEQQIIDDRGRCKHRQNPTTCPTLMPILSRARQALRVQNDAGSQHD